jgi:ankyrin repeat protein
VGYRRTSVVEALLERQGAGVSVDDRDNDDATALMLASMEDHFDTGCLLLNKGAGVQKKDLQSRTALHYAAKFGTKRIVEELLKIGAHINATYVVGQTPLHSAAMALGTEVYEVLQGAGGDGRLLNNAGLKAEECWSQAEADRKRK